MSRCRTTARGLPGITVKLLINGGPGGPACRRCSILVINEPEAPDLPGAGMKNELLDVNKNLQDSSFNGGGPVRVLQGGAGGGGGEDEESYNRLHSLNTGSV